MAKAMTPTTEMVPDADGNVSVWAIAGPLKNRFLSVSPADADAGIAGFYFVPAEDALNPEIGPYHAIATDESAPPVEQVAYDATEWYNQATGVEGGETPVAQAQSQSAPLTPEQQFEADRAASEQSRQEWERQQAEKAQQQGG